MYLPVQRGSLIILSLSHIFFLLPAATFLLSQSFPPSLPPSLSLSLTPSLLPSLHQGTGKTTTLLHLTRLNPHIHFLYCVYNKSVIPFPQIFPNTYSFPVLSSTSSYIPLPLSLPSYSFSLSPFSTSHTHIAHERVYMLHVGLFNSMHPQCFQKMLSVGRSIP